MLQFVPRGSSAERRRRLRAEAEALFPDLAAQTSPTMTWHERYRAQVYLASRPSRREEPYASGLGWRSWMA